MVKKSSIQMCQKLIQITERIVNPELTSNEDDIKICLKIIIPLIIKQGIDIRSEIRKALSVYIIVKICEKANKFEYFTFFITEYH